MKVRAHVLVSGRVQGVFFRTNTWKNAKLHNVTGWVRNLTDGKVEAVFEGEEEAVVSVIEFCKHGPPGSYVSDLDVAWQDWTGEFREFKITYRP